MLREFQARQVEGDFRRRWFADDFFDLYVWYEPDDTLHGFQLCYGKPAEERALTWTREGGGWHAGIDTGESGAVGNRTPMLVSNTDFPAGKVLREFLARGEQLSNDIREMVVLKISEYPVRPGTGRSGAGG